MKLSIIGGDGLVGSSAGSALQSGGNHHNISVLTLFGAAGCDLLRCHDRRTMNQVQSLTFTQFLIGVHEVDFFDDSAGLQSEPRTRSDKTTASNNADFHSSGFQVSGFWSQVCL